MWSSSVGGAFVLGPEITCRLHDSMVFGIDGFVFGLCKVDMFDTSKALPRGPGSLGQKLDEPLLWQQYPQHEQLLLSGGAEPLKSVHKREHEQLVESKHGALLQTATVHATSPTSSNKMAHESHEPPVRSRRLWL